jgi:hypothetical protein
MGSNGETFGQALLPLPKPTLGTLARFKDAMNKQSWVSVNVPSSQPKGKAMRKTRKEIRKDRRPMSRQGPPVKVGMGGNMLNNNQFFNPRLNSPQ